MDEIISFTRRGWALLPLAKRSKEPNTYLAHKGYLSASKDIKQITEWFAATENNVGIACQASGLVVLDIDNGEIPIEATETYTVKTRRGWHLYYLAEPNTDYVAKYGDNIDVKHKGYVVAPPSIHPNGFHYWVVDDQEPQPLPAAIAAKIAR